MFSYSEGSRSELREGVLPTLKLRAKSIENTVHCSHKRNPTVRKIISNTYATNLNNIRKQLKHYTKPEWRVQDSTDIALCLIKMLKSVHQPQYEILVDQTLKQRIWYFGWIVSNSITEQCNIKTNTITQFLNELESRQLCAGLNLDDDEHSTTVGQKHIITKSAVVDESFPYPEVKVLAYRYDNMQCIYNIYSFTFNVQL